MPECPAVNGSLATSQASMSSDYCGPGMHGMILTVRDVGIQAPMFSSETHWRKEHGDVFFCSALYTRPHTDIVHVAFVLHIFEIGYVNPFIE